MLTMSGVTASINSVIQIKQQLFTVAFPSYQSVIGSDNHLIKLARSILSTDR